MKLFSLFYLLLSGACIAADHVPLPKALPPLTFDAQGHAVLLPPCACPPSVVRKKKKSKQGSKRVGAAAASSAPASAVEADPFDRLQIGGRGRRRTEKRSVGARKSSCGYSGDHGCDCR